MNGIDIVGWTQILSNLGVIAGIIFLAIEVRQNQKSLSEGNYISRVTAWSEAIGNFTKNRAKYIETEELAELYLKGMAGEQLSTTDDFRFSHICQDVLSSLGVAYRSFGLLGDKDGVRGAVLGTRRSLDLNPGLRQYYDANKQWFIEDWGFSDFVIEVEGIEAIGPSTALDRSLGQ